MAHLFKKAQNWLCRLDVTIREVYAKREWHKAALCDMDELRSGNEIDGLAIIEAPSTTFFVPQRKRVRVDEYKVLWLEEKR